MTATLKSLIIDDLRSCRSRPLLWLANKLPGLHSLNLWARPLLLRLAGVRVLGPAMICGPVFITMPGRLVLHGDNYINEGCRLDCEGGITLCRGAQIGPRSILETVNHENTLGFSRDPRPITIGEHVWIASHALILPGVTIGAGSVVAAGSVVTRDIPAGELWAGNPAHFVKKPMPKSSLTVPTHNTGEANRCRMTNA